MTRLAKLSGRHNNRLTPSLWRRPLRALPHVFLVSDAERLPDPGPLLSHLPRGACVILRHVDSNALATLAQRIVPQAHRLGLSVLLSGDVRLALRTGADGVHLSEQSARRAHLRIGLAKPGFLITAAAHDRLALWRALNAGAQAVLLSPVFATASHPGAAPLGLRRFLALARLSPVAVIALGGVTPATAKCLDRDLVYGFAALDGWRT